MNQVPFGRRFVRSGAICLVAASAALAAPAAFAGPSGGDPEIRSDQRGFVPTTGLAGEGNVQIETGVAGTEDGTGTSAIRSWSTPTIVRFGMPNNYEIRLQSAAYSHVRTPSTVTTGMSDLVGGLKATLPQGHAPVSLAALIQATFPSGSSQLKHNGVRPELQLIGEWQLPHATALTGMAGVRSDVDLTDTRYPTGMMGVNLSHTWAARFDTYAEFTGRQMRAVKYGGKNMLWDVGGSWRALATTRINGSAGFGFKDNDTDMAWTVGISQRFRPPSPAAMTHRHTPKPEDTPSATTEDGK